MDQIPEVPGNEVLDLQKSLLTLVGHLILINIVQEAVNNAGETKAASWKFYSIFQSCITHLPPSFQRWLYTGTHLRQSIWNHQNTSPLTEMCLKTKEHTTQCGLGILYHFVLTAIMSRWIFSLKRQLPRDPPSVPWAHRSLQVWGGMGKMHVSHTANPVTHGEYKFRCHTKLWKHCCFFGGGAFFSESEIYIVSPRGKCRSNVEICFQTKYPQAGLSKYLVQKLHISLLRKNLALALMWKWRKSDKRA